MKNYYKLAANCLIVLSVISFNTLATKVLAQESIDSLDRPNVPLDNQVRFIGDLESRNSEQWNFAIGQGSLTENSYQLQKYEPDIRIVEQDIPQWNNTGKGTDYAILVTIYEDNIRENR